MIKNKTTKQSGNEALERIILDSLGEHPLWFQGGGTRESGSVWFVCEGCGSPVGQGLGRPQGIPRTRLVVVIAAESRLIAGPVIAFVRNGPSKSGPIKYSNLTDT